MLFHSSLNGAVAVSARRLVVIAVRNYRSPRQPCSPAKKSKPFASRWEAMSVKEKLRHLQVTDVRLSKTPPKRFETMSVKEKLKYLQE